MLLHRRSNEKRYLDSDVCLSSNIICLVKTFRFFPSISTSYFNINYLEITSVHIHGDPV